MKKQSAIVTCRSPSAEPNYSSGLLTGSTRHLWAMDASDALRQSYCRMYRPQATMIDAGTVIEVSNRAGVKFVRMGAHAVSGFRDLPRATLDVDVLVRKGDHRKAVAAIQAAYPPSHDGGP